MNIEAQRLLNLSIGKIAASRSQRGGINIHKNLLVAGVLHKARSAVMMENLQTMLVRRQVQPTIKVQEKASDQISTDNKSVSNSCRISDANTTVLKRSQVELETAKVSRPCNVENKENSPPKCIRLDTEKSREDKLTDSTKTENTESCSDKDNGFNSTQCTAIQEVTDYVNKQSCARCVKRRRSDHDLTSEDNENSDIVCKKLRLDSNKQKDNETSNLNKPEDMQTDSPQISNLVNIFNTGFSGLCANGNSENTDRNNNNPKTKSFYPSDNIYVHQNFGLSLDNGNSSCGTELIDHSRESVTMPTAIAV